MYGALDFPFIFEELNNWRI